MKRIEFKIDVIDNVSNNSKVPDDGLEEVDIEPIDWDCI